MLLRLFVVNLPFVDTSKSIELPTIVEMGKAEVPDKVVLFSLDLNIIYMHLLMSSEYIDLTELHRANFRKRFRSRPFIPVKFYLCQNYLYHSLVLTKLLIIVPY